MRPFRQNAFCLLVWSAIVATLITVVLMATRSAELATAFLIGANVALLFLGWPYRVEVSTGRGAHRPDRGLAFVEAGGAARGRGRPSLGTKQSRGVDVAVREGFFRHRHRPGRDRARGVG
jgi:hypothetical protein